MKLAVIVARFQNSMPTIAHELLIKHCKGKADKVLVVVGYGDTLLAYNNPLHHDVREKMLRGIFQDPMVANQVLFSFLPDKKYNNVWSRDLDDLISGFDGGGLREVTLYGGRDSFLTVYTGKHKHETVDFDINHVSSTADREQIHQRILNSKEWREGVIWASAHKYPVSYQTVDVAILKNTASTPLSLGEGKGVRPEVLLGRKPGCPKFQFIGGFVEPKHDSLEHAAQSEVVQECGPIEVSGFKYIGSTKIDDWRYRKEKDKILTAFFICQHMWGEPEAADDIEEVKWFDVATLTENDLEPEHGVLLQMLKKELSNGETVWRY